MGRRIKPVPVAAEDHRQIGSGSRGGNQHGAGSRVEVRLRLFPLGEPSGRLEHDLDAQCRHLLVPVLQTFHALHPAVRVHVTCIETPGAAALLRSGKLDLALMNLPYPDEALSFRLLREVQDIFVAGRRYREFSHVTQPLAEIVKQPMLLLERKSRSRQLLDAHLAACGCQAEPVFELGGTDLLIRFAQFDFGIACVPRSHVEEMLADGSLVEIRAAEPMPRRHVGAAWLRDMPMTAAAKALVGLLEDTSSTEF